MLNYNINTFHHRLSCRVLIQINVLLYFFYLRNSSMKNARQKQKRHDNSINMRILR